MVAAKKKFNVTRWSRMILLLIVDVLVVTAACWGALIIRYEFDVMAVINESGFITPLMTWTLPIAAITVALFALLQLYNSLWDFAGADEMLHILLACGIDVVILFLLVLPDVVNLPLSFPLLFGMLLLIMTIVVRFSYRFFRRSRVNTSGLTRTMLIGAGKAGALVLRELSGSSYSHHKVVCIIDDDPAKKGCQLMGVKIVGDRSKIEEMVEKYRVSEIILAIPTLPNAIKKNVWEICNRTGCKMKQMPGVYQLANGDVTIQQIRDIQIEDLLEREVVKVDNGGLSELIRDKTVMVTGGGGSIGSELCRQLAGFKPKRLVIFDIYENNAYAIEQELRRNHPTLDLHVLIGSVRDAVRMDSVMDKYRPSMVFHAAAHKHVPLMETSPLEAVKNNIFGTLNTVRAADKYGVDHFVLISTDKAVNPTNVMGTSKRVCEMIVQTYAEKSKTCFAAVRFGNVLGSNGSVIPLFREQIKKGGPVTVTDPGITRFFMTIPEAVSLVLQAGAFARGGEIFVLDMGSPVKIDDLARNMIRLSGFEPDVDIPIVYTGLRPGEKLYEELLMSEEGLTKTANDLIYIGHKIDFDHDLLQESLEKLSGMTEGQDALLRRELMHLVPTYKPSADLISV